MIEDSLGLFLEMDMSYLVTEKRTMAHILVSMDLREGFMENICLEIVVGPLIQLLDYDGVPFQCHRCHTLGHMIAQCNIPFQGGFLNKARVKGGMSR